MPAGGQVSITFFGHEAQYHRALDKIIQKERQLAREMGKTGAASSAAAGKGKRRADGLTAALKAQGAQLAAIAASWFGVYGAIRAATAVYDEWVRKHEGAASKQLELGTMWGLLRHNLPIGMKWDAARAYAFRMTEPPRRGGIGMPLTKVLPAMAELGSAKRRLTSKQAEEVLRLALPYAMYTGIDTKVLAGAIADIMATEPGISAKTALGRFRTVGVASRVTDPTSQARVIPEAMTVGSAFMKDLKQASAFWATLTRMMVEVTGERSITGTTQIPRAIIEGKTWADRRGKLGYMPAELRDKPWMTQWQAFQDMYAKQKFETQADIIRAMPGRGGLKAMVRKAAEDMLRDVFAGKRTKVKGKMVSFTEELAQVLQQIETGWEPAKAEKSIDEVFADLAEVSGIELKKIKLAGEALVEKAALANRRGARTRTAYKQYSQWLTNRKETNAIDNAMRRLDFLLLQWVGEEPQDILQTIHGPRPIGLSGEALPLSDLDRAALEFAKTITNIRNRRTVQTPGRSPLRFSGTDGAAALGGFGAEVGGAAGAAGAEAWSQRTAETRVPAPGDPLAGLDEGARRIIEASDRQIAAAAKLDKAAEGMLAAQEAEDRRILDAAGLLPPSDFNAGGP